MNSAGRALTRGRQTSALSSVGEGREDGPKLSKLGQKDQQVLGSL
jgi:hypothetical protein